jgi:soluble lytic murein transglycosylase-like protein
MMSVLLLCVLLAFAGDSNALSPDPEMRVHPVAKSAVQRLMSQAEFVHSKASEAVSIIHSINELVRACPVLRRSKTSESVLYSIANSVHQASQRHNVDRSLLYAMIVVESRCKHRAQSRAGAMGLMQLMPRTARWLGVRQPFSISENIHGGSKYVAYLLRKFSGNRQLALAAYNSGPRTVRRHRGVPPYRETRQYVQKVIRYSKLFDGEVSSRGV